MPVTVQMARAFVAWVHRHCDPPVGADFAIGVQSASGALVGVVLVGRPLTDGFDDRTAEVRRLTTDGTPNACSALLGAAWRASRALGYRRLIACTRADEQGACLRAAGFRRFTGPQTRPSWDGHSRRREACRADGVARLFWEISVGGEYR